MLIAGHVARYSDGHFVLAFTQYSVRKRGQPHIAGIPVPESLYRREGLIEQVPRQARRDRCDGQRTTTLILESSGSSQRLHSQTNVKEGGQRGNQL